MQVPEHRDDGVDIDRADRSGAHEVAHDHVGEARSLEAQALPGIGDKRRAGTGSAGRDSRRQGGEIGDHCL